MTGGHWEYIKLRCGSTKLEVVKRGDTLKITSPLLMIELYGNIINKMIVEIKIFKWRYYIKFMFSLYGTFPSIGAHLSLRIRTETGDNTSLRNSPDIDVVTHE